MSFLFEQNHFAIEQMFNAKDVAPEILESHNGKIRLLIQRLNLKSVIGFLCRNILLLFNVGLQCV